MNCFHYFIPLFSLFHSILCVFSQTSLRNVLMSSLRSLNMFIIAIWKCCASGQVLFSGPFAGFWKRRVALVVHVCVLQWDVGIWSYEVCLFLGGDIWSHLCWLRLLLFGCYCSLWIVGKNGGCGALPFSPVGPLGVPHRNCSFGLGLTQRSSDGFRGGWESS